MFQVKLEGLVQVPDLQRAESSRVLELYGCRILRLQGSMVQKLQSSRNPRLQVSTVSKLSELRVPGFQSRNPLQFLVGSLAGTFPDTLTKLADLV